MKNLLILNKNEETDLQKFIDFWSRLYSYPLEALYNKTIVKSQFEPVDIQNLFRWKNGMDLSSKKQNSVDTKIQTKIEILNFLKNQDDFTLTYFLDEFSNLTAVWKIFLLHIIKPRQYPIYDQHINRAYCFIHGLDYKNISASKMTCKSKEDFYFGTYLGFVHGQGNINLKKMDEAFFAFGQFLVTNNNAILLK